MHPPETAYNELPVGPPPILHEDGIESGFIGKLKDPQGLATAPEAVPNLKGAAARAAFINHFKEVQRLKTQLDQYTDLTGEDAAAIERILPKDNLLGFRSRYLETAQRLKAQQGKGNKDGVGPGPEVEHVDFEFVLFASAVIDYDYIMGLISRFDAANCAANTSPTSSRQKSRSVFSVPQPTLARRRE